MGDSENSQPQDDSDEDIYKDFSVFNFEDELAKLEGSKETYKQEALDLSEKLKLLTEENLDLKKSNEVLKKNLSTLLKTAQAEVKRKDSMIEELRNEVESLTFRRNRKQTKEKVTSTDDLDFETEVKSELRECKCVSEDRRSKSYENRTSSVSDYRSYEEDDKKRLAVREKKSLSCDSDNESGYYRDESRRFRKRHHTNDSRQSKQYSRHNPKYDKNWYPTASSKHNNRLGRMNLREESNSQKKNRGRHKEESSERRRSRHKEESPERRRSRHKEESPERKRRSRQKEQSTERRRSRHKEESPDRTRSRQKEQSTERRKIRQNEDVIEKRKSSLKDEVPEKEGREPRKQQNSSSTQVRRNEESFTDKPNADSVIRININTNINMRETDSTKSSDKSGENKTQTGDVGKEKREASYFRADGKNNVREKHVVKNERRSVTHPYNTKSPLDALYNEMVASRNHHLSYIKPGNTHPESKPEPSESEDIPKEDWALSFKNERPDSTKPMTLYSKRMMQKLENESRLKKNEAVVTKQNDVEFTEGKKSEKTQETLKIVEEEKEPGELTDDENVVESSKEFQELTKVASIESIIENPVKTVNEQFVKDELEMFEEPTRSESRKNERAKDKTTVKPNEFQKPAEAAFPRVDPLLQKETEIRDAIEFSPFKNNYKLIEISPIKPPGPEHVLDFHKKRLPSSGQSQKEVETSIFNLLSSLSGVPIDKEVNIAERKDSGRKSEDPKEILKPSDVKPQGEVSREKPVEAEKTETDNLQDETLEERAKDSKSRGCSNRRSRPKTSDEQSRKGKGRSDREKNSGEKLEKLQETKNSKTEVSNTEEITPGETTQFLDFFLLTTSPSKPIVPELPEKASKSSERSSIDSLEDKSVKKTVDTTDEDPVKADVDEKSQSLRSSKSSSTVESSKEEESGKNEEPRKKKERLSRTEEKAVVSQTGEEIQENKSSKRKRKTSTRRENENQTAEDKSQKRKRGVSECEESGESEPKKQKTEKQESSRNKTRSKNNSKNEPGSNSGGPEEKTKEDISTFEFFKPIAKKEKEIRPEEELPISSITDYKMTTKTNLSEIISLETPNKRTEKVKNLLVNEHVIHQVLDSKIGTPFSPLTGSKFAEMTPRRMLKNDLMLTDSEDDSTNKPNLSAPNVEEDNSESDNSECYSDSGASDFVDLL